MNNNHGDKVDAWMPLDIGRFLQDTLHLSATQIGNYMLLLLSYWATGPLENDPEQLARIAREDPYAWSIAQAKLSMFFSIGEDGRLHQAGADRRIAEWRLKRQKARAKASNAARVRWDRYRANKQQNADAPSIHEALHEQCPSSVVQEQKQKQEQPPNPPALRTGGLEAPAVAPPGASPASMPQASPAPAAAAVGQAIAAPPGARPAVRGASTPPAHAASTPAGGMPQASPAPKSEQNKKPPKNGAGAISNGRNGGYQQAINMRTVQQAANANGGHRVNRPDSSKGDVKENAFKKEVSMYWQGQNPEHPDLTWKPADDRALHDLLRGDRAIDLALFRKLLKNRANSEVNPAALPHKWLRGIMEFAAGPLDKYGKPIPRSRRL